MTAPLTLHESPPMGWVAPEHLSESEWQATLEVNLMAVDAVANLTPWIIGDLILEGERLFGENVVAQAIDPARYPADTLRNWAWVASRFEPVRRLTAKFGVYQALAGVKDEDLRYQLLQQAADEGWTVSETRKALKAPEQDKEPSPFVKVDKQAFTEFLNSVNEVLPKLKVTPDRQIIEGFLNEMVKAEIWGGIVG